MAVATALARARLAGIGDLRRAGLAHALLLQGLVGLLVLDLAAGFFLGLLLRCDWYLLGDLLKKRRRCPSGSTSRARLS
jgi:hypothetical protein